MRYAQGGGLTTGGRRRREQVRLEAARRFERRVPTAVIAAELRVSERSVRRWRQAWQAAAPAGLASRGQAAQCRLDEQQLAALDVALEAGPLAAGWEDQRWTLARVRDLVAGQFRVQYTIPGIWYLLQRRTQVRVRMAPNTPVTRTKRHSPAHHGASVKIGVSAQLPGWMRSSWAD